jgi:hypothetical protein
VAAAYSSERETANQAFPACEIATMSNNDFYLSRIEANGWNAAHSVMQGENPDISDASVAKFNPYSSGPERDRWLIGFGNALRTIDGGREPAEPRNHR